MSIPTKFMPILQKSGPGRWWRWQNKTLVLSELQSSASFGTVAAFGGIISKVQSALSMDHEATPPQILSAELEESQETQLKSEELWQRPVCSDFQSTKDPWASYFHLPQHTGGGSSNTFMNSMFPERKLESALADVPPSILIKRSA